MENDKSVLSDDELIDEYERASEKGSSDAAAMQAVVCIILAVGLFGLGFAAPELADGLFRKLRGFMEDTNEIMPNPLGMVLKYIAER